MTGGAPTVLHAPRLVQGLAFAVAQHGDQTRKGSDAPYITHLLATAGIVGEFGGDEDEMVAGLLHDTVEDTGGRPVLQRIRLLFGEPVASIVEACSDHLEQGREKPAWAARKRAHLERLASAQLPALRVVAADKLHNSRSLLSDLHVLGDALWERFSGGREGSLWYYRSMTELLRGRADLLPATASSAGFGRLVAELDRTVRSVESLAGRL